jgi:hypothetical protein
MEQIFNSLMGGLGRNAQAALLDRVRNEGYSNDDDEEERLDSAEVAAHVEAVAQELPGWEQGDDEVGAGGDGAAQMDSLAASSVSAGPVPAAGNSITIAGIAGDQEDEVSQRYEMISQRNRRLGQQLSSTETKIRPIQAIWQEFSLQRGEPDSAKYRCFLKPDSHEIDMEKMRSFLQFVDARVDVSYNNTRKERC